MCFEDQMLEYDKKKQFQSDFIAAKGSQVSKDYKP